MRQTLKANLFIKNIFLPIIPRGLSGYDNKTESGASNVKKYFLPYLTINETLKSMRHFCTKKIR